MEFKYGKVWEIEDARVRTLNEKRCELNDISARMEIAYSHSVVTPISINNYLIQIENLESEIGGFRPERLNPFDRAVFMDISGNVRKHRALYDFYYSQEKSIGLEQLLDIFFGYGAYNRLISLRSKRGFQSIDSFVEAFFPFWSREVRDDILFSSCQRISRRFSNLRKAKYRELDKIAKGVISWFSERGVFVDEKGIVYGFSPHDEETHGTFDRDSGAILLNPNNIILYRKKDSSFAVNSSLAISVFVHELSHKVHADYSSRFFPDGLNDRSSEDPSGFCKLQQEGSAMVNEHFFLSIGTKYFSEEQLSLARKYFRACLPLKADFILASILHQEDVLASKTKRSENSGDFKEKLFRLSGVKRYSIDQDSFNPSLSELFSLANYSEGFYRMKKLDEDLRRKGVSDELRFFSRFAGFWSDFDAFRYFVNNVFVPEFSRTN